MAVPHPPEVIADFHYRGRDIRFLVQEGGDLIQGHHHGCGRFYELEELALIERRLTPGGVYLDIGANVGNHVVFVASYCGQKALIAVEPNPPAWLVLERNVQLNKLQVEVLRTGLSDATGAAVMTNPPGNLGAARVWPNAKGDVTLVTGDSLFEDRAVDFIKIDVEAHELKVLRGLARTIAANRPEMFIEVDNENRDGFDAWLSATGYLVLETFRRYPANENFLVAPCEGRPGALPAD